MRLLALMMSVLPRTIGALPGGNIFGAAFIAKPQRAA
jgi:hypothetical protein